MCNYEYGRIGPTVLKIVRGNNEIDYKSLTRKIQLRTLYTIELECILNGQPWWRFALSDWFLIKCTSKDLSKIQSQGQRQGPNL